MCTCVCEGARKERKVEELEERGILHGEMVLTFLVRIHSQVIAREQGQTGRPDVQLLKHLLPTAMEGVRAYAAPKQLPHTHTLEMLRVGLQFSVLTVAPASHRVPPSCWRRQTKISTRTDDCCLRQ